MRFNYRAMGPVFVACAFLALTSCSKDSNEPNPGPASTPIMNASVAAVTAYDIVKVSSMTVDGNLNEWANIAAISMADNSGRAPGLDNTAKVKLAWSDTYLYVAYDVTDTELLATQTTRDHADIYKDDAVELYIDPQGDGSAATSMTSTDYQFLANLLETVGDSKGNGTGGKDFTFNASSFLAKAVVNGTLNASGADVGYTAEFRISWTDLGVTPVAGNFMRIDPAVDDNDTGNTTTQEFDWAGLTQFNNPSGWKDVQLINRPAPPSAYDILKVPAAMTIDGNLADWAGIAAISIADDPANGRGALNNTAKVKLAWDPTYLYMAYDVTDTDLEAVQTARDAADIYKDDEIEFYVDPQGDGWTAPVMTATDYQFLANVLDAVGDKKGDGAGGKDASFNAPSFLAKAVINGTIGGGTDVGYTVEARIAWAELGVTPASGNFLRIDPAVGDRDGSPPPGTESFDWAGLTAFNNPMAWKDVQLAVDNTAPATPANLVLAVVSSSQIDVSWTASTSTDVAKYNIYRSTTGTPTLYKTVTGSPYHDTGLIAGTYTYQISAVDAAGNESPPTLAKSATTTATGFAFGVGPWHAPTEMVGATAKWSGTQENGFAPNLRRMLDSLRASHARVTLSVLRSAMKNATTGSLSFSMFTNEITAWKTAVPTLGDYFTDGTVVAINIMDDASSAWTPAVTPADIDSLAHIVKNLFPNAVTSARQAPAEKDGSSYFGTGTMQWLDLAWAQYDGPYRDEAPATYRTKQVAGAKAHGLGLILALNVLDGGCGSPTTACLPGIPGTNILGTFQNAAAVRRYQMSATEVTEYGKLFIQEPYNCTLLGWTYSSTYGRSSWMVSPQDDAQYNGIVNFDSRSDVISAWQQLVSQGKSRGPGHCTRAP